MSGATWRLAGDWKAVTVMRAVGVFYPWIRSAFHFRTPSPHGQLSASAKRLPVLLRGIVRLHRQERTRPTFLRAQSMEHRGVSGVCRTTVKNNKGLNPCVSKVYSLLSQPRQVSQHAATHLATRLWVARPSVQVLRSSPTTALPRVQPSVPLATWHIASSTRVAATDPNTLRASAQRHTTGCMRDAHAAFLRSAPVSVARARLSSPIKD